MLGAEEEDSKPLLGGDGDTSDTRWSPTTQVKQLFKTQRKRKIVTDGNRFADALSADQLNISASNSLSDLKPDPPDNIVVVFIVAFDTRCGNIIEWSMPDDVDLETVEFKAMPSGAHTVTSDFLFFRKGNLYGVSCFEKMPVNSEEERGVRMKSVGVLATSYTMLHKYVQFLEQEVRHQLQTPGNYEQLAAFYDDKKGVLSPSCSSQDDNLIITELGSDSTLNGIPEMTITHPVGCFLSFVRFFGEKVFVLWKLSLLQKRVLFFSPPPIGIVCYRVYCTSCLSRHNFKKSTKKLIKPFFYVNIADIENLEREVSYIACTTEKVFSEKPHLYDVFVDNRVVRSIHPGLKDILKVNRCDEEKYQQLLNHRQEHIFLDRMGEAEHHNEEHMFASFFAEQNNRIFQTLTDVSTSDNRTLTSEHMHAMGLDPKGDREFVLALLELYDINVLMVIDNPCCPL